MNRLLVMVLAMFALAACGGLRDRNRDSGGGSNFNPGTWGHLNGARSSWLVQLQPGATISVCGVGAAEAERAVRMWAEVIGRDQELAIDRDCDRQADRVVVIADRKHASVDKACKERPEAAGLALVDYGVILLCVDDNQRPILLHEIGHLWGLCDVYPLPDGVTDNCDPRYFTGRSRSSVMGASYAQELAGSDRTGLMRLSTRPDVGGNDGWPAMPPQTTDTAMSFAPDGGHQPTSEIDSALRASDVVMADDLSLDLIQAIAAGFE